MNDQQTTAMESKWEQFNLSSPTCPYLLGGDEVKFSAYSKDAGKIGVVVRKMTKNYVVMIDGREWVVNPSLISQYRRGTGTVSAELFNKQISTTPVKVSAQRYHDSNVQVDDVVLFWRGMNSYDIMRISFISNDKISGILMNGRSAGKRYKINPNFFVQKLDKILFQ